jgi:hypothetical protein
VRDRDQLCARTDRAFERGEVELPGCVVVYHVDLDPDARLHLQDARWFDPYSERAVTTRSPARNGIA